MRRLATLVAVLAVLTPCAHAQDPRSDLQKKLNSAFVLTRPTADNTDIVKAGSILELHQEGLIMYSVANKVAPTWTFKDGRLGMGFGANMSVDMQLGSVEQGVNHLNVPQRKFVSGEKVWITGALIKEDGVILQLYSDAYDNVRYFGQIKFPFAKKTIPPADEMMKTIAEVVTADAPEGSDASAAPPAAAPSQQIAPPPPPADAAPVQPKTISVGQTKDQVVEILGQPGRVAKIGAKEIDYYPDMKVIFVNGKVTDIQ
jgi:hypothetical protein